MYGDDVFYRTLAEFNPYFDRALAEKYQEAMAATIMKLLKTHGVARIPHISDIYIIRKKPGYYAKGRTDKMPRVYLEESYQTRAAVVQPLANAVNKYCRENPGPHSFEDKKNAALSKLE